MRIFFTLALLALMCQASIAQSVYQNSSSTQPNTENIYTIKQQYLYNILHNPTEKSEGDNDNDLERFNRWFHDAEVRCYPTGNLPRPDVLLRATALGPSAFKKAAKATADSGWQAVGPMLVPANFNGIGRINCIVIDPVDTNTLYVGSACGGVHISHDGGTTWTSSTDNFPSLSIADIAVNPIHTDTIFAATGDGYGYETGGYNIFWGGLYSAGVMRSTDGGNTWDTTGLSFLQSSQNIIQKLLIYPRNPNILLAASRTGIWRTTDAGATWTNVVTNHVYSMAFRPFSPDTIYAVDNSDLLISYDIGATWHILTAGINPSPDRATIAVSNAAPSAIWLLDAADSLHRSHNGGLTFSGTSPANDSASFYGYYDRVLAVSPNDSNHVYTCGEFMAHSVDGGMAWYRLNPEGNVHVDNHALTINPKNPLTVYTGNDGGISVTHDGGLSWSNLGNGLMISQIYRMSSSQASPYLMLCGLQDNGTFKYNATNWLEVTGGDGMDCAICPTDDKVQVSSYQNGNFFITYDNGLHIRRMTISTESADWTAPVTFDPQSEFIFYVGYEDIYATYDQGLSFLSLTTTKPFPNGATIIAVAPSNSNVIYAADNTHILRTEDGGVTWADITSGLPVSSVAITRIAVDYNDPMHIYVTLSGYYAEFKLFSTTPAGGWTNLSAGLPNLPADCVAVDSSNPGAIFVGTDIGVYYTDSLHPGWNIYSHGLPNVIAEDLKISYPNHKIRVATYGRGVWEAGLQTPPAPSGVANVASQTQGLAIFPNPSATSWKLVFQKQPATYEVKVTDISGRVVAASQNNDLVDAAALPAGVYTIEVFAGDSHYTVKAIKE